MLIEKTLKKKRLMRSVTKINAGLTLKFNERKSNKIMENQAVDEKTAKWLINGPSLAG